MGGLCVRYGRYEKFIKTLVRKPSGKRPLGRSRCRWEDDIKINLREKVCADENWITMAQSMVQWYVL